jgi:hypothetical protein
VGVYISAGIVATLIRSQEINKKRRIDKSLVTLHIQGVDG